jgi:hypothetical protein
LLTGWSCTALNRWSRLLTRRSRATSNRWSRLPAGRSRATLNRWSRLLTRQGRAALNRRSRLLTRQGRATSNRWSCLLTRQGRATSTRRSCLLTRRGCATSTRRVCRPASRPRRSHLHSNTLGSLCRRLSKREQRRRNVLSLILLVFLRNNTLGDNPRLDRFYILGIDYSNLCVFSRSFLLCLGSPSGSLLAFLIRLFFRRSRLFLLYCGLFFGLGFLLLNRGNLYFCHVRGFFTFALL